MYKALQNTHKIWDFIEIHTFHHNPPRLRRGVCLLLHKYDGSKTLKYIAFSREDTIFKKKSWDFVNLEMAFLDVVKTQAGAYET